MHACSIGTAGLRTGYGAGKTKRGTGPKGIALPDEMAARTAEFAKNYKKALEEQKAGKTEEESETDSKIIVKPDGSRVLVTTVNMGGMKMVTSLEISKPTDLVNTLGTGEEEASADL